MTDFELRLSSKKDAKAQLPPGAGERDQLSGPEGAGAAPRAGAPSMAQDHPVSGYLAVVLGLLGIFGHAPLFVPFGFAFTLAAFFKGQGVWAWAGLLLNALAFLSSPILMGILGFSALVALLP